MKKNFTHMLEHLLRRVHDVVIEEPQHQHSLPDCFVVPPAVFLELTRLQMERQAVEFNYEESFKKKVDGAYTLDPDLCLGADPYVAEKDPCQGFQEGPCTPVHFGQNITGLTTSVAK